MSAVAWERQRCNRVAYDGIQVHGGKGYMRDHLAERYYRDARITNIYEGTTQMQVVAAIAGVKKRTLNGRLDELAALPYTGRAAELAWCLPKSSWRNICLNWKCITPT